MKILLSITLLFLICPTVHAQKSLDRLLQVFNSESIPYISVSELKMMQSQGEVLVLDAREIREFEVSHIPGAIYVGYSDFSSENTTKLLRDSEAPIVVYCSLGIRSETVGEKLKKAGFSNVRNLYGGIFEWKNKGYTVLDKEGNETENVHTASRAWGKWLHSGVKVFK